MFQSDLNRLITATLISLILVLIVFLIKKYIDIYSYWKRRGINGPPNKYLFLGNFFDFSQPLALYLVENHRKYGKIYGIYQGVKPALNVADPNLIKRVLVQDFHIFRNRPNSFNQDRIFRKNLAAIRDNAWKRIRSILSPMFTTSKLKKMESLMQTCIDSLTNAIEKQTDQSIMIRDTTGNFTMDVIAKCAFATETNAHQDKENYFIKNAVKIFDFNLINTIVGIVTPRFLFDLFTSLRLPFYHRSENEFFINLGFHLIKQRQEREGKHFDDMLQLMMDARLGKDERYEKADEFDSFQVNLGRYNRLDDKFHP
ncbi:phosphatidylinositol N-acetylglucosaminyltransferase subunit Q [Sarcoptes scabiei]|nr:phosphatidylinositol N-acetylglucosaminyltransferase subunit Q [Sarcoptes scabiei]